MNHGGMSCGTATFSDGLIESPYCLPPGSPDGACQSIGSWSPAAKNFRLPRILMNESPGIGLVDVDLGPFDGHRARRLDVARARRLQGHVRRRLHLEVLPDFHLRVLRRLGVDALGVERDVALGLEQHVAALGLD